MNQPVVLILLLLALLGSPLPQAASAATSENDGVAYRQVEMITDVLSLIRSSYVEPTDLTELTYGAVRGMLQTLDPHSSFLTPELYTEMQEETQGEFGGLGIEVTVKEHQLIVVTPLEDSPAYRAGIQAGDRIVAIDGEPTRELEIMQAVRMLRGPKGEPVRLRIQRGEAAELLSFTIVRDIIQLQSVKSRPLDGAYGYVRISQFQAHTGEDLEAQLLELHQQRNTELAGLILDLRNNPGGLLDQAVTVADFFLEEGLIVYTEGREDETQLEFSAQSAGTQPDYPLVVLINGGSASAAEIVAGALQDHARAIILGEPSFGKGSVQSIIPLGENAGLRLTTARYFTPKGRSIQARGIFPDITVPSRVTFSSEADERTRERDLENHFKGELEKSQETAEPVVANALNEDYQLRRALELLKGHRLMSR